MKRQIVSACLVGTMLLGSISIPAMAVSVDKLIDVEKSDWFYPYVQYVAEQEYMEGIGGNKFAPEMEMSRAMFVTVLYRLDDPSGVSGESKFVDVPADTWYTEAVNWAVANGIVDGIGGNKFAPDSPITREQICTMMTRYLEYRAERDNKVYNSKNEEKIFPDADLISDYAKEAVKKCQMWGLMVGDDKGYINPANNATRAEIAAVIQRLDALLAAGEDVGGGEVIGGGGTVIPTPTPETASYTVKVTLEVPDAVSTEAPRLAVVYNDVTITGNTVSGDKTFGTVVSDLVNDSTANALERYINQALSRVKGKTTTQTLNGQQVTVSVSEDGVISASVAVKVTDFTSDKTRVSQEELEALIGKLQNGGSMTFTKAELVTMNDLLSKIDQVAVMKEEEIQNKIDQVVAEKPDLAQVVSGMTPKAVKQAAADYKDQVEQVFTDIGVEKDKIDTLPTDYTSQEVTKEPVLMDVTMNLGAYYEQMVNKFESSKHTAIRNMETQLGLTFTADQKAKAEALYNGNTPANFVTDNQNGTLTLKDTGAYVTLIQNNAANSAAFYKSLGQNAAFYEELLQRAEDKYQDGYGVSYNGTIENMAALLGDKDGIFVDENKKFRNDMTFSVTVTASEETYSSWLDLISGKFSQASVLPGQMPGALNALLGEYTMTVTLDKQ